MFHIYNIYALAAFGTIGGMLFGFDISSMSAWIGADSYKEYFGHPSSTLQGGITASMSGGSLVGALVAGFLADSYGRRGALKLASVIWIIGAVLQCSSQNVAHLIVGRVVSGLAIGITSSQCCVYLAELAPSRIRGRIVGIQQWSIEWGILIMYLISYGCIVSIPNDPKAFRIAWGIQGIPGLILGIALLFFPESPRWLGQKDRWEECHEVLAHLHAGGDREAPIVLAELDEVREAARIAAESKNVTFFGLFGPRVWKRTLAGCSVQETILKISSPKQSNLPSGQVPTTTEENGSPAVSTYVHGTEGTEANDTNPTTDNTAPSGRSRNISAAPFSSSKTNKERATATQATSSTAMLVNKPDDKSEVEHSDGHNDKDKSDEDDNTNKDDGEYIENNNNTEFIEE
ncbi:hypothetical protein CPAR01_07793 [Colletotrichum paranaense]|uniref:Major facilitator superfamily (MFS) profile domain-containing protein n=1 Tax=Colletotrichum paranaense TaxID=1914294 RepID=A0ABQ9SII8_9PEZI|nr:uncharacterized protein CPAR01_07793 [Colletotrichum paranaense]KAK1537680.1 hypothetical protein CPAR01_07793 [Colletotrichum paranaense]